MKSASLPHPEDSTLPSVSVSLAVLMPLGSTSHLFQGLVPFVSLSHISQELIDWLSPTGPSNERSLDPTLVPTPFLRFLTRKFFQVPHIWLEC